MAAGGADDLITINERRFAVTPHWYAPAKIARQAALPKDLAVSDLQASQVTAHAQDIEQFTIDRGRAPRPLCSLRHALLGSRPKARHPQRLAIRLGQGPNDFVIAAIAHAEDPPGGDGRTAVAAAESLDFPGERWAIFRPFLEEAALLGDGVPVGALPLRPIEGLW